MAGVIEAGLLISAGYSYVQRVRRVRQSSAAATQIQRRARALSARVRFARDMRQRACLSAAEPLSCSRFPAHKWPLRAVDPREFAEGGGGGGGGGAALGARLLAAEAALLYRLLALAGEVQGLGRARCVCVAWRGHLHGGGSGGGGGGGGGGSSSSSNSSSSEDEAAAQHWRRLWKFCVRCGGIPAALRPRCYLALAGCDAAAFDPECLEAQRRYCELALRGNRSGSGGAIATDVPRTYGCAAAGKRRSLTRRGSLGSSCAPGRAARRERARRQGQLWRLLGALAAAEPDVGYCQGMDYVAAQVLELMLLAVERAGNCESGGDGGDGGAGGRSGEEAGGEPWDFANWDFEGRADASSPAEEDGARPAPEPVEAAFASQTASRRAAELRAFALLRALLRRYGLGAMFARGMEHSMALCEALGEALRRRPRRRLWGNGAGTLDDGALAQHLEQEGVHPSLFMVGWTHTLFTYLEPAPRELLLRLWDIFLAEGRCCWGVAASEGSGGGQGSDERGEALGHDGQLLVAPPRPPARAASGAKVILRVALAVLDVAAPRLLTLRMEGIVTYLGTFHAPGGELRAERVLRAAFGPGSGSAMDRKNLPEPRPPQSSGEPDADAKLPAGL